MRHVPWRALAIAVAGPVLLGPACQSPAGYVEDILRVALVEVTPSSANLTVGSTLQLTAIPKTLSGIALSNRSVQWSSSDPELATVAANGLVRGISVGGPVLIRATADEIAGEATIRINPLPIERVVVAPVQIMVPVGGSAQLAATAYDVSGNLVSGQSFSWQSSAPSIADVTTTGIVLGLAEGGPVTITATAAGVSSTAIILVFKPATRLGFLQQPGPGSTGLPLSPAVRVAIQDDLGRTVSSATAAVTIGLGSNPGGATLTGTLTVSAVNGVATFSNLVLDRPGDGYTLAASSPGLAAATSAPFNVPAPPLAIATQPSSSAQSGVVFSQQPVITVRDGAGNPVNGVVVTATIASGGGTLGGTATATSNANGSASYSNLSISGSLGDRTLHFAASGYAPVVSNPIALGAGAASKLTLATQPSSSAQNDAAFAQQPVIQLRDASDNPVSQAGVTVTAELASGAPTLGGTLTVATNASGAATFTNLTITGLIGTRTIRFIVSGLTSVTSNTVTITPGSATQLSITTQPSSAATSGTPFAQQPVIQLRDVSGNNVSQAGVNVVASIATGSGAALSGTTAQATAANGAASFTGLTLTGSAGTFTLGFASTGLTGATSNPIALSAGAASRLTITVQPSSAAVRNVAFPQQPVIQLRDAAGNAVSQSGVPVTASIQSGPGSATLGGTLTVNTNASGTASFTNLRIDRSGVFTLRFSSGTLQAVISNSITIP